jgi:hypothetical protein
MIYKWATHLQTKQYLFQLMGKVYVSETLFKTKLKEKKIDPSSFNAGDNWSKYLEILVELSSSKRPCLVCGAPMVQGIAPITRKYNPQAHGCIAFNVHSLLLPQNLNILDGTGAFTEKEINIQLGEKCEAHGLYMAECHECIKVDITKHILEAGERHRREFGMFQYLGER